MRKLRSKAGRIYLQEKINEYFNLCDTINNAANDKEKHPPKPYTLSGLLCHLDISEKQLFELEQSRLSRDLIMSAKRRIEAYIEENALNGKLTSTAAINSLKEHFDWSEKEKVDDSKVTNIEISLDSETDSLAL